jgi:methionyl-tRNA formyltransferase
MPSEAGARTIFFGSGSFAVGILQSLAEAPEADIVAVVTAPDRPAGRGGNLRSSPVAAKARQLGVRVLQPKRLRAPESLEAILVTAPALGVLADYGQLVPGSLLDAIPAGILNVHPSLLPRHRGATPIPATILRGDPEAGVTIFQMDEGLDTGPLVASERLALNGTETTPELESTLSALGALLLRRTLGPWLARELRPRPQDDAVSTMTRPLRREDGRLDPERDAADLERQVRAYQPWPGSFLELPARLLVWKAEAAPSEAGDSPGALVRSGHEPALATKGGRLRLLEVQPAGGKRMTGAELLRGRPSLLASGS